MPTDIFMRLFFVGSVACLILAAASVNNPQKFAFICKVRTRRNGFLSWLVLALLCVVAMTFTAPKDEFGKIIIPEDPDRSAVSQEGTPR